MKLKKVLVALGFSLGSLTLIAPTPSKAAGGCPDGFVPVGGGYCRNIICPRLGNNVYVDEKATSSMKKYGLNCPGWAGGAWGNKMIPMR